MSPRQNLPGSTAGLENWVLAGLSLFSLAGVGSHLAFSAFFTPLREQMGWSGTLYSSIFSVHMIVYLGAQWMVGLLSDRFGVPATLAATSLLFGLGLTLMGLVTKVWQAYIAYGVLISIGFSGSYLPAISLIRRCFGHRRSFAMGIISAGSGIGVMLFGPLAQWMGTHLGPRQGYPILGGIVLLIGMAAAVLVFLYTTRVLPSALVHRADSAEKGIGAIVRTAPLWALLAANSLISLSNSVVAVHAVPLAVWTGIPMALAVLGLFWIGLGRVAGSLGTGHVGERVNRRTQYLVSCLGVAVASALFPLIEGQLAYFVLCLVYGVTVAVHYAVLPLLTHDYARTATGGASFGFVNLGYGIGSMVGSLWAGRLFDLTQSYRSGFWSSTLLAGLAVWVVFRLLPRLPALESQSVHER